MSDELAGCRGMFVVACWGALAWGLFILALCLEAGWPS